MSKRWTSEQQRDKRLKRKTYLRNILGNKCANCGGNDRLVFDHIQPASVSFRIAGQNLCRSMKSLMNELNKCQLLCHDCHWEKTKTDMGYVSLAHGTVNMYSNKRCRCQDCRSAWSIYVRPRINSYRKKQRDMRRLV